VTYSLKCGCVKAHTCDAVVRRGEVERGATLRACEAHGGPACTCPSGDGSLRFPCPQHPPVARRRYAAGRRIKVPTMVRTVRDLLRRHLREEGRELRSLAAPWNVQPATVKTIFHQSRPLSPQYVDAAIEFLKLDDFDALEIRLQGAIKSGWQLRAIKPKL